MDAYSNEEGVEEEDLEAAVVLDQWPSGVAAGQLELCACDMLIHITALLEATASTQTKSVLTNRKVVAVTQPSLFQP